MPKDSFDKAMDKWNGLRERLKLAKKNKEHKKVIEISSEVLTFSASHPEIQIVDSLFEKEIGNAYEKLGDIDQAHDYFSKALHRIQNEQKDPAAQAKILENKIIKLKTKL